MSKLLRSKYGSKIRNVFFLIKILSVLWFWPCHAQNTVLVMPPKYWDPHDTITKPYGDEAKTSLIIDSLWLVYSDRAVNLAYDDYDAFEVIDTLNFMEACAVLQIEANRLKLGRIADRIQDKYIREENTFWVDINKIVLSPYCKVANGWGINKKGIILNILDTTTTTNAAQGPVFYDQPDTAAKKISKFHEYDYKHVFIFKVSNDSNFILVGRENRMSGHTDQETTGLPQNNEVIIGWAENKYVVPWNHRIAWELNWDTMAVAERRERGGFNGQPGIIAFGLKHDAILYGKQGDEFEVTGKNVFHLEPNTFYNNRLRGIENHFILLPEQIELVPNETDSNWISPNLPKKIAVLHYTISSTKRIAFIFKEAYAVLKPDNYNFPLFKNVVFIDSDDFISLRSQLSKLNNSTNIRKDIKGSLNKILYCILGDSQEELGNVIFAELIYSLSFIKMGEKYEGLTINDIEDPGIIGMGEIIDLRFKLLVVYEKLKGIREKWKTYEGATKLNGTLYFWVPLHELIPE